MPPNSLKPFKFAHRGTLASTGGFVVASVLVLLSPTQAAAAFGLTSSGGNYAVDTGAGLVFKVSQSSGDINSIVFNSVEYQSASKNSHIASGLGTDTTVAATTYGTNYIKLTITTSPTNGVVTGLTQYLMVRNGVNTIYLATYTTAEPAVGELRWITRLQASKLTNGPIPSDNRNNTGAIESADVFGMADGTTRSKYYGDSTSRGKERAMDLTYCGASGPGVGMWMVYGNRESSSGGPFFRDIQNQCGADQEIYNYMNSGHNQTEAWRVGNVLHGPYALVINSGSPPALPVDFSWIETGGLNLLGWVATTDRGAVTGVAYGIPAGFAGVVGFANANAQYWASVATNGSYVSPLMKPGDYTVKLYKDELEVATNSVTVIAPQTNRLDLVSSESAPTSIFRIGEWSGTPAGFLNAGNIPLMHPQDVRNANWANGNFVVGANTNRDFPAIQFRGTNSPANIVFNLNPNQVAALTLRIGISCAYNGGRPKPAIGSWAPANPAASSQPSSRSFTIGTYRGNNTLYTWTVPASAFVAGQNTLSFGPISGSTDLGTWLSAGYVIDAIEMSIPNTTPNLPAPPSNLTATSLNGSQIQLTWTVHATNEVNVLIERSQDNANFALLAALGAGTTSFLDERLAPGATYYYRVRTFNAGGHSSYSSTALARTTLAQITTANILNGHLTISGTGGTAGGSFALLGSTNLAANPDAWIPLATNRFSATGTFTYTNQGSLGSAQFFRLKIY